MHELGDVLYAERTLVKMLPKLAKEATDSALVGAIEHHLSETEQHVTNLEAAFEAIGEKAKAEPSTPLGGRRTERAKLGV